MRRQNGFSFFNTQPLPNPVALSNFSLSSLWSLPTVSNLKCTPHGIDDILGNKYTKPSHLHSKNNLAKFSPEDQKIQEARATPEDGTETKDVENNEERLSDAESYIPDSSHHNLSSSSEENYFFKKDLSTEPRLSSPQVISSKDVKPTRFSFHNLKKESRNSFECKNFICYKFFILVYKLIISLNKFK